MTKFNEPITLADEVIVQQLQTKLAERDKTILEQQLRVIELSNTLKWYIEVYRVADEHWDKKSEVARLYKQEVGDDTNLQSIESALKAERIKTLEDAADHFENNFPTTIKYAGNELRRMANELKEQK